MNTKRKKVTKYRGSKTHGGGSMKKRRGAGSRGGRGKAGTGKKGDVKKPSYWQSYPYSSGKGFVSRKVKAKTINLYELNSLWQGKELDLGAMGYDKLLGRGLIYEAVQVKIPYATPKAIKKIESVKGKVIMPKAEKESSKKVEE